MSRPLDDRIGYTYDIDTAIPSNSYDCVESPEVHTDDCT